MDVRQWNLIISDRVISVTIVLIAIFNVANFNLTSVRISVINSDSETQISDQQTVVSIPFSICLCVVPYWPDASWFRMLRSLTVEYWITRHPIYLDELNCVRKSPRWATYFAILDGNLMC